MTLRKKIIALSLVQLVLFAIMMFIFLNIAPWLASEPIENLKSTDLVYQSPPKDIVTYSVNHGEVIYSERDTIANDPIAFAKWAVPFLLLWFVLFATHFPAKKLKKQCNLSWREIIFGNT